MNDKQQEYPLDMSDPFYASLDPKVLEWRESMARFYAGQKEELVARMRNIFTFFLKMYDLNKVGGYTEMATIFAESTNQEPTGEMALQLSQQFDMRMIARMTKMALPSMLLVHNELTGMEVAAVTATGAEVSDVMKNTKPQNKTVAELVLMAHKMVFNDIDGTFEGVIGGLVNSVVKDQEYIDLSTVDWEEYTDYYLTLWAFSNFSQALDAFVHRLGIDGGVLELPTTWEGPQGLDLVRAADIPAHLWPSKDDEEKAHSIH